MAITVRQKRPVEQTWDFDDIDYAREFAYNLYHEKRERVTVENDDAIICIFSDHDPNLSVNDSHLHYQNQSL
jgi:hypothetical protein